MNPTRTRRSEPLFNGPHYCQPCLLTASRYHMVGREVRHSIARPVNEPIPEIEMSGPRGPVHSRHEPGGPGIRAGSGSALEREASPDRVTEMQSRADGVSSRSNRADGCVERHSELDGQRLSVRGWQLEVVIAARAALSQPGTSIPGRRTATTIFPCRDFRRTDLGCDGHPSSAVSFTYDDRPRPRTPR